LSAALEFVAILPTSGETLVVTSLRTEYTHDTAAQPPVRLHLYHQILVI
jgi:hypothetical protein